MNSAASAASSSSSETSSPPLGLARAPTPRNRNNYPRRSHTKSRRGCRRCKLRKIKVGAMKYTQSVATALSTTSLAISMSRKRCTWLNSHLNALFLVYPHPKYLVDPHNHLLHQHHQHPHPRSLWTPKYHQQDPKPLTGQEVSVCSSCASSITILSGIPALNTKCRLLRNYGPL